MAIIRQHKCSNICSVLEPGRTLTLAEKGGAGAEVIHAAPGFRLFATMNPGQPPSAFAHVACQFGHLVCIQHHKHQQMTWTEENEQPAGRQTGCLTGD